MISLILVDAEVELVPHVPGEDRALPRICTMKHGELRGLHVLDSYIHRHVMEGLEGAERRGRPDILHSFLLLAQASRHCREGKLRSYVHTRGDEVIEVGQVFQADQSYLAFLQDLGALFCQGKLGAEEEGLRLRAHMTIRELLAELAPDEVVVLSPSGDETDLGRALLPSKEKHLAVIIGGFPEGDYRSEVYALADAKVTLGEELLTVPDVTARVLGALP
jgi:rRNA small subunit pseudouridine methyltransferase Nep1